MSVYCVVQFTVTDPSWLASYGENVTKMVEAQGGKYLARTSEVEAIEGIYPPGSLVVLLEWASKDDAVTFYNSEEYKPFKEARTSGSEGTFLLVAGKDDLGLRRE
jgi:uncharacterized protein (DUF1330 family)